MSRALSLLSMLHGSFPRARVALSFVFANIPLPFLMWMTPPVYPTSFPVYPHRQWGADHTSVSMWKASWVNSRNLAKEAVRRMPDNREAIVHMQKVESQFEMISPCIPGIAL